MAHRLARTLLFVALGTLGFGLLGGPLDSPPTAAAPPEADAPPRHPERVVFLGGELTPEQIVVLTSTVAASGHPGLVLLDSNKNSPYLKAFLAAFRAEQVIPVGCFPEGRADLEQRLGTRVAPEWTWRRGPPRALWDALFPHAEQLVVCPAEPRGLLLQSACLAGLLRAPLFVVSGALGEPDELRRRAAAWGVKQVYAAGDTAKLCHQAGAPVVHLPDADAVAAAYLRRLVPQGPVETLVVANPADTQNGLGGMSSLAPWVALQRRAALLLTNDAGTNADEVVKAALRDTRLRRADNLLFVAGLKGVPMHKRPNPIPADKDQAIEMEPLTPTDREPVTFATGRLFHDDLAVVPLVLARQRLLTERPSRKALVASNPGGSLPLLETFSRHTIKELKNAGFETQALIGGAVTRDGLRQRMPECDVFLWEGHHNTLIKDWAMPEWDEPLPPSLVFLQSCLALHDWKAQPLLSRGAVGVVGTSTRTYSASGGACSLAFFDALLYENASFGGSLRQAKNFLLAYSLLKEKRLGKDARRSGANLRAAWAFTLWGDPTMRLPAPAAAGPPLPTVQHEVRGRTIVLALPDAPPEKIRSGRYQAQVPPNARLAGLLRKTNDADGLPLVPFVFAEVRLPNAPPGQAPKLRSRLPASNWVFCWDARRRCGYLLATPRPGDKEELRFHIEWEAQARMMKEE